MPDGSQQQACLASDLPAGTFRNGEDDRIPRTYILVLCAFVCPGIYLTGKANKNEDSHTNKCENIDQIYQEN
jgi:hypothetical protein